MQNDELPFEQAHKDAVRFIVRFLSSIDVNSIPDRLDMMEPDNVHVYHRVVDHHCELDGSHYEWIQ